MSVPKVAAIRCHSHALVLSTEEFDWQTPSPGVIAMLRATNAFVKSYEAIVLGVGSLL